jgi:hypothetical protein
MSHLFAAGYRLLNPFEENTYAGHCGLCENAATYNDDRDCWCNKHNEKVDEEAGTCMDFKKD